MLSHPKIKHALTPSTRRRIVFIIMLTLTFLFLLIFLIPRPPRVNQDEATPLLLQTNGAIVYYIPVNEGYSTVWTLFLSIARLRVYYSLFYPIVLLVDDASAYQSIARYYSTIGKMEIALIGNGTNTTFGFPYSHPAITDKYDYALRMYHDAYATSGWTKDPLAMMHSANKSFGYWAGGDCPGAAILMELEEQNYTGLAQPYRNYGSIVAWKTAKFTSLAFDTYMQDMGPKTGLNETEIISGFVALTMNSSEIEFMDYIALSYNGTTVPKAV